MEIRPARRGTPGARRRPGYPAWAGDATDQATIDPTIRLTTLLTVDATCAATVTTA
jgi:hypothetical protein